MARVSVISLDLGQTTFWLTFYDAKMSPFRSNILLRTNHIKLTDKYGLAIKTLFFLCRKLTLILARDTTI